jgi:hypothetical protein
MALARIRGEGYTHAMKGSLSRVRSVLSEPLARFFALGALMFSAYALLDDAPPAPEADAITLAPDEARRLAARFEATWRRAPSVDELSALMRDWVEEEALVREARALGLDRGDAVVRQRLRQKMAFFAESGADAAPADEAILRAHLAAHPDRFATPPRIAFAQVYLGETPAPDEITATREALAAGADPGTLGAPTLLPASLRLAPASVIESAFGPGFFDRLAAAEADAWDGPVKSALGVHLVRVTAYEPARTPPFEAARDQVEADWRSSRAESLRDAFAEALVARYRVALPDPAAVLGE